MAADDDVDVEVGARVRLLLWEKRIPVKSAAVAIGVDPTGFGRRLRGERKWTLGEVRAVARFLDTSVGALFGER